MCGICGIIGKIDKTLVKQMNDVLEHRGPDGEGYFFDDKISFGHRRLAIIDPDGGKQPMISNDNKTVVIFNGEIYNFEEIRDSLRKNYRFTTDSDTEVILAGYQKYHLDIFPRLNGMFALAIYDKEKKQIILARDRFGIKPLYYTQNQNYFLFASEIKALFADKKIERIPNEKVIYEYLVNRIHDNTPETFFQNIFRLMPGHFMSLDVNGEIKKIQKFWSPPTVFPQTLSPKEKIAKFKELFLKSVRSQIVSDVPLGSCLSGGLDSSAIVCTINNILQHEKIHRSGVGNRQKTFSAIFPGEINNEEKYINEVTKSTNTEHYAVTPRQEELWQDLKKLVYYQEEPFVSSGPYAQWCVAKLASQKVKVVLDGQGADELLAGYIPYFGTYLKELLIRKKIFTFIKEITMSFDLIFPYAVEILKSKLGFCQQTIDMKSILNDKFVKKYENYSSRKKSNSLTERLKNDLFFDCIPALLRYEDKNAMAHSLESRVPFLDNNLVDFILSLEPEFRIKNGWNKWIMREALRGLLPEKIRTRRKKVGFTTPEISWMRKSAKEIKTIFESESFKKRSYFNQKSIKESFELYLNGKTNDSLVFWRLINLEFWFRIFIDEQQNTIFSQSPEEPLR